MLDRLTVDRSRWARGPWNDELEDFRSWPDDETGLHCEIWRDEKLGHWCGRVRMPVSFAAGLTQAMAEMDFDAHGGVVLVEREGDKGIEFHCGHSCDISPGDTFRFRQERVPYPFDARIYRTTAFAVGECRRLARQIKSAAGVA